MQVFKINVLPFTLYQPAIQYTLSSKAFSYKASRGLRTQRHVLQVLQSLYPRF